MPQRLERERDADDLADRVDRADLVEVHLLGRDAVDAALGDRELLERALRARLRRARAGRAASIWSRIEDQCRCGWPGAPFTVTVVACDPVAVGLAELDAQPVDAEVGQLDRGARVDQRAEQHVARDAADAVDVEDHAGPSEAARGAASRAIRAAIVPAPNPSSMFTTATPAAHEVIIASSALTPPKVAP